MGVASYLEQEGVQGSQRSWPWSRWNRRPCPAGSLGHLAGIEGIGDGFIPPLMNMGMVTRVEAISTQESVDLTLRLMREEGIMGGISTGANVAAALRVARDLGPGRRVTLAPTRAPGTSPPYIVPGPFEKRLSNDRPLKHYYHGRPASSSQPLPELRGTHPRGQEILLGAVHSRIQGKGEARQPQDAPFLHSGGDRPDRHLGPFLSSKSEGPDGLEGPYQAHRLLDIMYAYDTGAVGDGYGRGGQAPP